MTHENQGKRRWYETLADGAHVHGLQHPNTPRREGWSFSVYNGAEEHASGWGSASLADMAPALLAAIGMTDAATANKRAQAVESLAQELANDRDGAVEALDIANDTLGKVCALMAGAGFDGDLLSAVSELINSRNNAIKARDSKQREIVEVWSALGSSSSDSASVLAKRACANLNRWEAFTREQVAEHEMLDRASITTDLNDRHYDLRLALGDVLKARAKDRSAMRGALKGWEDFVRERLPTVTLATDTVARHTDLRAALAEDFTALATENDRHRKATREQSSEDIQRSMSLHAAHDAKCGELSAISRVLGPRRGDESVFDQADRARKILDCWHSLALKHLPDCPQLRHAGHGNAGFDLGTLHFELRGFMSGEISALRERLAECAAREDSIIAALGRPCSTNTIATEVEHLTSDVRRYRHSADFLAAENAHLRSSLAAADSVVRLVTSALETPEGVLVTEHAANVMKQCERAAVLLEEVTRLNRALENTGGYGAREAAKSLRKENEGLRNQVATLTAAVDGDLARSARVLAVVRTALETPEGAGLADHAAEVVWRAKAATVLRKRLNQWVAWGCRAACVVAADDDTLRSEIDKALPMWRRGTPEV